MNKNTAFVLIISLFALIVIPISLFIIGPEFIQARLFYISEISDKGAIGDAFGGILSPIIGIIAVILTFMAFYIQYELNNEQRSQFKKQNDDILIERFESRYFELIRLHRENVTEQNIQNIITGRKVFTTYYFELRYIYILLEYNYDNNNSSSSFPVEKLTNIAYLIFFFGIGHVTDKVFEHLSKTLKDEPFFFKTIERLKREKADYRKTISQIEIALTRPGMQMPKLENLEITNKGRTAIFIQVYEPFTGHGTKIGHYYRHLFQTVKYVDSQDEKLFSHENKYNYLKILRAQLSNFEQVLFYYNSISVLGTDWINLGFINNYHLITNLPLSFADFGLIPEEKFKNEIASDSDFFDWQHLGNFYSEQSTT